MNSTANLQNQMGVLTVIRDGMQRLRFAYGRIGVALRIARRKATRRLVNGGMRCPECKGKGVVVNCEIVEFIEEVGLPVYYAATMLAHRADQHGGAESLPTEAWKTVGLSDYESKVFLEDMRNAWPVWECNLCSTASHAHITEQAFEKAQRVVIAAEQPST